jgi:hypothetical protein
LPISKPAGTISINSPRSLKITYIKVISKYKVDNQPRDIDYWQTKAFEERLERNGW